MFVVCLLTIVFYAARLYSLRFIYLSHLWVAPSSHLLTSLSMHEATAKSCVSMSNIGTWQTWGSHILQHKDRNHVSEMTQIRQCHYIHGVVNQVYSALRSQKPQRAMQLGLPLRCPVACGDMPVSDHEKHEARGANDERIRYVFRVLFASFG